MKGLVVASIALGIFGAVDLSPIPVAAQSSPPTLCGYSRIVFERGRGTVEEMEKKENQVLKNCHPGETIMIPTIAVRLAAQICDFSKTVVTVGDIIVCMVGQARTIRSIEAK